MTFDFSVTDNILTELEARAEAVVAALAGESNVATYQAQIASLQDQLTAANEQVAAAQAQAAALQAADDVASQKVAEQAVRLQAFAEKIAAPVAQ